MSDPGQQRVVFVCPHGIGDLVMLLPVACVASRYGWSVFLLVKSKTEQAVAKYFCRDQDIQTIAISEFRGSRVQQALGIAKFLRSEGILAAVSQHSVDSRLFAILTRISRIPNTYGWAGPLSFMNTANLKPVGLHKTLETARMLEFLGVTYAEEELDYDFVSSRESRPSEYVVFSPGSGEAESHKRWPAQNFSSLARRVAQDLGLTVLVLGSPNEKQLCDEIANNACSALVRSQVDTSSIEDVLDLVSSARMVVSNCNGMSHMADAVGVPTIALYGPTNPWVTGVRGRRSTQLRTSVKCAPCYRRGFIHGCGDPICMEDLSVRMVYEKFSAKLAEIRDDERGLVRGPAPKGAQINEKYDQFGMES